MSFVSQNSSMGISAGRAYSLEIFISDSLLTCGYLILKKKVQTIPDEYKVMNINVHPFTRSFRGDCAFKQVLSIRVHFFTTLL